MCGVFGFTGPKNPEILEKMGNSITHRGPDDFGFWANDQLSLGMRRLSIVDLETGSQPVFSEDKSVVAVFNGEIYNHVELRRRLIEKGHHFRSHHSDSEVLVHLYEELGPDYLLKLNGMFGIALWDQKTECLHLARDHSGIKPLYFTQVGSKVIFGSEIKAILAHPDVQKRPNFRALSHYFSFKNIPAPYSAFEGIEQVRPGERIVFHKRQIERKKWWQVRFQENLHMDEKEAAQKIRSLLEDSVRLQMQADVQVGAYLSGGLDSSSVVALMSRMTQKKVKTFTLTYDDKFNHKTPDRVAALEVSKQYQTEHYEYLMTDKDILQNIIPVLHAFDEPFSGVTSTFFLTKLISKHVKVALSGDGADELFGSYLPHRLAGPLFHYAKFRDRFSSLTEAEKSLLSPFAEKKEYLESLHALGSEKSRRMQQYVFSDSDKGSLFSDKMKDLCAGERTEDLIGAILDKAGTNDPLNRTLFLDFNTLLPDQILPFVDRLSMAHSVEVRPPFLDDRLISFAATIPGSMKIKNGRVKHILKEALADLLPKHLIDRPKEGFVLPINDWLSGGELKTFAQETLTPSRLSTHGLFQSDYVQNILTEHFEGRRQYGSQIWNLLMFQIWWEKNFV